MSARLRRALLICLLCILPVQSTAAVLVPLLCSPQESHHVMGAHEADHGPIGHAHAHGPAPDGSFGPDAANDSPGHLCCHQFSSAAPAVSVIAAPQDFRVHTSTVSLLTPLHIPELPQRPPRG